MSNIKQKRDLLVEIDEKMKNQTVPTEKEKEQLQYKLNRQLTEEDHLYIFTEILQNMEHKIYTMTENGTLFDINDLDHGTFWKIQYYVHLFLDNQERRNQINEINQENDASLDQFKRKITDDLNKIQKNTTETDVGDHNLSNYDRLRRQALSQCQYSSYSNNKIVPCEKSVYSDNFQYKWKQNNKDDDINKKVIKIVANCEKLRTKSTSPHPQLLQSLLYRKPKIYHNKDTAVDDIDITVDDIDTAVDDTDTAVDDTDTDTDDTDDNDDDIMINDSSESNQRIMLKLRKV
jgi:hypothetical protein